MPTFVKVAATRKNINKNKQSLKDGFSSWKKNLKSKLYQFSQY